MRWSLLRLLWLRELRDLFRDRRTVVLIFLMPVILYPIIGFVGVTFAGAPAAFKGR